MSISTTNICKITRANMFIKQQKKFSNNIQCHQHNYLKSTGYATMWLGDQALLIIQEARRFESIYFQLEKPNHTAHAQPDGPSTKTELCPWLPSVSPQRDTTSNSVVHGLQAIFPRPQPTPKEADTVQNSRMNKLHRFTRFHISACD